MFVIVKQPSMPDSRTYCHRHEKVQKNVRTSLCNFFIDNNNKRKLYLKKDGSKAEYTQIRARCGHYPDMFEALPGNLIRLKDKV
jgi:hypothetical protein